LFTDNVKTETLYRQTRES